MEGPTVELPVFELELEFEFELEEVDEGEDEEAVAVLLAEDDEESSNGFESSDRDACVRSNVNCRILSGPC
jgi:hypothetical protein